MNSDTVQLVGLAVLVLAEQYMIAPWQFPVFARAWDIIAKAAAWLSYHLSFVAMRARANYYLVVNSGT
jgi:hypothetical protein